MSPLNDSTNDSVTSSKSDNPKSKNPKNKKKLIALGVAGFILLLGIGFVGARLFAQREKKASQDKHTDTSTAGGQFSEDAIQKGKYLSLDNCEGEGSKQLTSGPMRSSEVGIILPYGLMVGGHVTPIDHQYFYGKDQSKPANSYDVLAPADGKIVAMEYRPRGSSPNGIKGDYRVVISYSCTFFSYFDLATSLAPEIAAQMPAGWESKNGPQKANIQVKSGQVVAKVGAQSLDYAVWDTTKDLDGLVHPDAYNNYEPWKISTVNPLDYYSDQIKNELLPFYIRTAEPRDGIIDHDADGTAAGGWFKQGTNGYIGAFKDADFNSQTYADGHLAIAPDYLDPSTWIFSTGAINHGTQYSIKEPSIAPDKFNESDGVVKYELAQFELIDETGGRWMSKSIPKTLKVKSIRTVGTVLLQMTAKRELKVELFSDKNPSQVSEFTGAASIYTRGEDARIMMGPDQSNSKPRT
jgi:hypothetical protein